MELEVAKEMSEEEQAATAAGLQRLVLSLKVAERKNMEKKALGCSMAQAAELDVLAAILWTLEVREGSKESFNVFCDKYTDAQVQEMLLERANKSGTD